MLCMAKKKNTGPSSVERIPFHMRLPRPLRDQLEQLAARNLTDVSTEIIAACLEKLRAEKLWPPQAEPKE